MNTSRNLSSLIQEFFTEYLINQRRASQHTIASYRDTFCLLFKYTQQRFRKPPVALQLSNLDARFISEFLNHLEKDRGVSARSRNQRLAAIRSFFRFISLYVPEHIELIQQVLAIPSKRYEKKSPEFLERPEIDSPLEVPDCKTWIGRRDHALLMLMIQTGIRVSELTSLCYQDVVLGSGAYIRCRAKGRKERCTPLMKQTIGVLRVVKGRYLQAGGYTVPEFTGRTFKYRLSLSLYWRNMWPLRKRNVLLLSVKIFPLMSCAIQQRCKCSKPELTVR